MMLWNSLVAGMGIVSFVANVADAKWHKCTRGDDAELPCIDKWRMDAMQKYFLTLYGHSCYSLEIWPSDTTTTTTTTTTTELKDDVKEVSSPAVVVKAHVINKLLYSKFPQFQNESSTLMTKLELCHGTSTCIQQVPKLYAHSEYLLIVGVTNSNLSSSSLMSSMSLPSSSKDLFIQVSECDPWTFLETIGIALLALLGICVALGFLCSFAEYAFHVDFLARSSGHTRTSLDSSHQFTLLNQTIHLEDENDDEVDMEDEKEKEKNSTFNGFSFSKPSSSNSNSISSTHTTEVAATSIALV